MLGTIVGGKGVCVAGKDVCVGGTGVSVGAKATLVGGGKVGSCAGPQPNKTPKAKPNTPSITAQEIALRIDKSPSSFGSRETKFIIPNNGS